MAVTLVVEDGTGLANANTYVSLAAASSYISANIHAFQTWDALDDDDKKSLLIWSTRLLDQRTSWRGLPTTTTQALQWPRIGATDRNGESVSQVVVPQPVRDATAELARYLMTVDRTLERDQDGLSKIHVDVIEIDFNRSYRLPEIPMQISYMLTGLGAIASGNGSTFAKIRRV